jgi:TonB family protein
MTNAITEAWNGANVSQLRAPRVYVNFTIARDGSVSGVELEQQTNNPTVMERAALQAVRRAKLPPLPADYHGPPVTVRFYFDYAK